VLHAGGLGGLGDVLGLILFLLAGEVLPEVGHGVDAVGAGERLLQALDVVQVGFDHLGPGRLQRLRLVLARIARDGAAREAARFVREDRPAQATALRARRSQYCNHFCH
jgi:hypothetical protein